MVPKFAPSVNAPKTNEPKVKPTYPYSTTILTAEDIKIVGEKMYKTSRVTKTVSLGKDGKEEISFSAVPKTAPSIKRPTPPLR